MTTSTKHKAGQPINVILADQTIVLMWIVKTEAIRQYSVQDMKHAEVELADFEAVILAKHPVPGRWLHRGFKSTMRPLASMLRLQPGSTVPKDSTTTSPRRELGFLSSKWTTTKRSLGSS